MIPTVKEALKKKRIIDEIDSLNSEAYSTRNSDPSKSIILASRALDSAEEQNYSRGFAFSLHIIGLLTLNGGELQAAVEKMLLQCGVRGVIFFHGFALYYINRLTV